MKKKICALTMILALCGLWHGGNATAQCTFNAPGKAKQFKTDMVRVHESCPGPTHGSPNTVTSAGLDACTAPVPVSDFVFGAKGYCRLQLKSKLESQCPDGSLIPCSNPKIKVKCSDVRDAGDVPIAAGGSGAGWSFAGLLRLTTNDETNGDMTVVDFPFQFNFGDGDHGKLKLSATMMDLCVLCGPGMGLVGTTFALPVCTQLELLSAVVNDPSAKAFATPGIATR